MKKGGRYDVSSLVEAQYEPGSNDTVLRNLLEITDPDEMDRVEVQAGIDRDYKLMGEIFSEIIEVNLAVS
ncbi:MAG: hypothetical protein AB1487_01955 [Thermodesulfobacteriota bacterium]